jgi:hypothetical protein
MGLEAKLYLIIVISHAMALFLGYQIGCKRGGFKGAVKGRHNLKLVKTKKK